MAGRRILVTGAQQGIGAQTAIAYAPEGDRIAINWFDDCAAAEDIARTVRSLGGEAVLVQGDVGTADGCRRIIAETCSQLGGIDVLVNNAGIFPLTSVFDITEDAWDRVMGVNVKGAFFCAQAAAKAMIEQGSGGAIVNLSSCVVSGMAPTGAHYVASKAALIGLTRTLAAAFAEHGIRVNAVAPGLIDTAQPRAHMSDAGFEAAKRMIPLKRIGDVGEIADTILFLASDAARYMTGQTIHVNGGMLMR